MEQNTPMQDPFLEGNELIEDAISRYYTESSRDNLIAVLEAIRQRMHADGSFLFPVSFDEKSGDSMEFLSMQTKDGRFWTVAFTSQAEFEKGDPSQVVSNFIDVMLRSTRDLSVEGFVINPWGQYFLLTNEMIERIFKADGDVEYTIPNEPITRELLKGGTFLKRAININKRNHSRRNLHRLASILRDSLVWIPCTAILSDADSEMWQKAVAEAQEKRDLSSLVGQEFVNQDVVRLVPDILQSGENFFFPVFTSAEEMGEYGERFSKVEKHFLEAVNLAKNNEKKVLGIVINPFSEPFVVANELADIIAEMESAIEEKK